MKVQLVKTGKVVDCHHSVARALFARGTATHLNPQSAGERTAGLQEKKKLTKDERAELEELREMRAILANKSEEQLKEEDAALEDEEEDEGDGEEEDKKPAAKKPGGQAASKGAK